MPLVSGNSINLEFKGDTTDLLADIKRVEGELNKLSATNKTRREEAKRAAAEEAKASKSATMSITDLRNAYQMLAGAAKETYQFVRGGAEIGYAQQKFDNLSKSIGTTSELLLSDLKTATKGTLSDMELMASATDLVGLGLANSADEAVRLATVSAGLGMNMNQLVLTLTNMTTMRFDALGVRVDGFKEKVKALEEQGYSTDEAFREAFLQQAEQQLATVGSAADSTLGDFQRLEAQTKNLIDSFKIVSASLAGPVVDALARSGEMADHYREVLEEVNPELAKQYAHLGRITPEMRKVVEEQDRLSGMAEYAARMLEAQNAVMKDNTDIVKMNEEAHKAHLEALKADTDQNKQFINDMERVADINKKYNEGLKEADDALAAGDITIEEHTQKVAALADEYDSASKRIVASMLEMKYMADGVFTDQEMSAYIDGLEKLGIVTAEDAKRTRELMVEAELLTPAFSGAGKGAERFDEKIKNLEGRMDDVTGSADDTAEGIKGIGEAAAKAHGPVAGVVMALGGLPPSQNWYYGITISVKGKVPHMANIAGGSCFAGDTPVQMADGTTKPIEQIRVGDVVTSYDLTSHRHVNAVVVETFAHLAASVGLYLKINGHLRVTAEHLVWNGKRWIDAGALQIGDTLLDFGGDWVTVQRIEVIQPDGPVYNIHTNHETHNYFAGNVLVHNAKQEGWTGGKLASFAGGGKLGEQSGWVIVGDSPGGGWTPYTEVIDLRNMYVYDAKQSKKMRDAGMLGGAMERWIEGPLEHTPGIPIPTAPRPSTGGRPNLGGRGGGGGRVGGAGGGVVAAIGAAMEEASGGMAPASEQLLAQQYNGMQTAMQQQAATSQETNKILKDILSKTASATDIGRAVVTEKSRYS